MKNLPPITPEDLTLFNEVVAGFEELVIKTFPPRFKMLAKMIKTVAEEIKPFLLITNDILEQKMALYPNKRVIYLATHGKGRTRKKNINRIKRWTEKQGKTPSAKRSSRGCIKYVIERDGKKRAVFVP